MEIELQNKIKISVTENEEFNEEFSKFCFKFQKANSKIKLSNDELLKVFILSKLISDNTIYSNFIEVPFSMEIPSDKSGLLQLTLLRPKDYIKIDGKGAESIKRGLNKDYNDIRQIVYHYAIENPWKK